MPNPVNHKRRLVIGAAFLWGWTAIGAGDSAEFGMRNAECQFAATPLKRLSFNEVTNVAT
jgi:hypothetical protein